MSGVCVGNDVVDLENPRTQGRAGDERFVRRVFGDRERHAIGTARDPDLELWCRWAAKEAGFKVISKLLGAPPPFVHRRFEVGWYAGPSTGGGSGPVATIRRGAVSYGELRARVSVARHPGAVHAVAYGAGSEGTRSPDVHPQVALLDAPGAPWAGSLEELLPRFTAREADAVYSRWSAAVRLGARAELAERIGVEESRLEIVCAPGPTSQRPPRVLLDGGATDADVSLSHDGRLIAWAVWVGEEGTHGEESR